MSTSRVRLPRYNRRIGSGNIPVSVSVDFQWYGQRVEDDVTEALVAAMDRALSQAIKLTQLPGWTPYRTGDLVNSIINLGVKLARHDVIGTFGSPLHYALFQELGTSRFSGKFYLTRAGLSAAQDLENFIREELSARGY